MLEMSRRGRRQRRRGPAFEGAGAIVPFVDDVGEVLEVKKDDAEQEERAEESGEDARVPLGSDRDRGDDQKYADEVGTD